MLQDIHNVSLIENLDEKRYHSQSDHTEAHLTYSIAKNIIQKSLRHAWHLHPHGGKATKAPTPAMELGSFIHNVLLNKGDRIVEIDANDYKTKLAQEVKAETISMGKIPILKKKMKGITDLRDSVFEQLKLVCPDFFNSNHFTELTAYWKAIADHHLINNEVKCQSRWDWISPEENLIIDIKTTSDASPLACSRKIVDMGYYIQEAMYVAAAEKAWPERQGLFVFKYLFVETEPPYAVNVVETDDSFMTAGRLKAQKAINAWRDALIEEKFPGYDETVISRPRWLKE